MTEVATHRLPRHGEVSGDLPDRRALAMEFMDPLEPLDATTSLGRARLRCRGEAGVGDAAIPGDVARWSSRHRCPVGRCVSRAFRIGIGGFEGLRDDRQMTLQQAFDGLAHVLQEVPSIGDLLGVGRGFGGRLGVGRGTVAADQLDAGMGRQPGLDGRGVAIGQEVDDFTGLEVDDDGAVASAPCARPSRRCRRISRAAARIEPPPV